jgi:hypothetical protein
MPSINNDDDNFIFVISVFRADKFCSTLSAMARFLTRQEFSRADAEALWEKSAVQGELHWLDSADGPKQWAALLEELG